MAVPLYSIGPYAFISMDGPPPGVMQSLEIDQRSGVDGSLIWKAGLHGQPFQTRTVVDVASISVGEALYRNYEALTDADPQVVAWDNIVIVTLAYQVLNVRLLDLRNVLVGVGGKAGANYILRCEWVLQPVIP